MEVNLVDVDFIQWQMESKREYEEHGYSLQNQGKCNLALG